MDENGPKPYQDPKLKECPDQYKLQRCEYALRVALQTMKERCVALQRRLATMEEENLELRERLDEGSSSTQSRNNATGKTITGGAAENLQLRLQVAELSRQKAQLSENINMVSNENRQLWSRLSQIAKEQANKQVCPDIESNLYTEGSVTRQAQDTSTNLPHITNGCGEAQNLIRSKTFTKHSPNQNLRPKNVPSKLCREDNLSLEEVALNVYEDNCNGAGEDLAEVPVTQFRFGFLKDDETASNDSDYNQEAKKCFDGLQDVHREALQQQRDLNAALAILESRIALQPCSECVEKVKKPEMADKSLETDESLSEPKLNGYSKPGADFNLTVYNTSEPLHTTSRLNIIQEKVEADALDKTCPMCGKIFTSQIPFSSFCEHVELHFIDDSHDLDASVERNFEFISHAVGDF